MIELAASSNGSANKYSARPGFKAIEDRPKPEIQAPGDAIVKIVKTTIYGTDLHILKGDVATCAPGRILGHEGVGIIDSVGAGVTAFRTGDRVLRIGERHDADDWPVSQRPEIGTIYAGLQCGLRHQRHVAFPGAGRLLT